MPQSVATVGSGPVSVVVVVVVVVVVEVPLLVDPPVPAELVRSLSSEQPAEASTASAMVVQ
jgi:hypothetical protein